MNTFGEIFRLTTFGESHGPAIGGVIDGVPANLPLDTEKIQLELDRRRPGQSAIVTRRNESDRVELLSGVFEGRTLGTPIGFLIRNVDQHSSDYEELRTKYRPGHADYTYQAKYGHRDFRGGGRASARETACRVVGGAVARQILDTMGIRIYAYTSQVGDIKLAETSGFTPIDSREQIDGNPVRCPDTEMARQMYSLIEKVKAEGDTVGGVVTGVILGLPAGLGEPVFGKFQAILAHAMMSINAAKGFEYGIGFHGASRRGSEIIDTFTTEPDGRIGTLSNYSGGIQGGITNGQPVYFRVAFKPVATLLQSLPTIDMEGNNTTLAMRGRHDPCVLPRAVPVVEAMAAMCTLDAIMLNNARGNLL